MNTKKLPVFTPIMLIISIIIAIILPPVGIPILAIYVLAGLIRLIAWNINRKSQQATATPPQEGNHEQ